MGGRRPWANRWGGGSAAQSGPIAVQNLKGDVLGGACGVGLVDVGRDGLCERSDGGGVRAGGAGELDRLRVQFARWRSGRERQLLLAGYDVIIGEWWC